MNKPEGFFLVWVTRAINGFRPIQEQKVAAEPRNRRERRALRAQIRQRRAIFVPFVKEST